jgi:hypothetical protein
MYPAITIEKAKMIIATAIKSRFLLKRGTRAYHLGQATLPNADWTPRRSRTTTTDAAFNDFSSLKFSTEPFP